MKYALILLISTMSFIGFAQSKNDRKEILNLLEKQRVDWNSGDIEAYMNGYLKSDSLLFVGKNGPTYGWQKTLENYQRGYPDKKAMGYLTFDI